MDDPFAEERVRLFRFLKQYAGEAGMDLRSIFTAPFPIYKLSGATPLLWCLIEVSFVESAYSGAGVTVTWYRMPRTQHWAFRRLTGVSRRFRLGIPFVNDELRTILDRLVRS